MGGCGRAGLTCSSQSGGHGESGKVNHTALQHQPNLASSQEEDETKPLIDQTISPDPELLAAATKFVAEIIEKAKAEAAIRLKRKKLVSRRNF